MRIGDTVYTIVRPDGTIMHGFFWADRDAARSERDRLNGRLSTRPVTLKAVKLVDAKEPNP